MTKYLFSILISFSLMASPAHAAGAFSLLKITQDLSFSLNVEWDQVDQAFYDKSVKDFDLQFLELVKDGLNLGDVLEVVTLVTNGSQVGKDVLELLRISGDRALTQHEFQRQVFSSFEKNGSKGAAWNGSRAFGVAVLVLNLLMLTTWVYLISEDQKNS